MEKYRSSLGFCGLSDPLKVKGSFLNLGQVTPGDFDVVDTSTFLESAFASIFKILVRDM